MTYTNVVPDSSITVNLDSATGQATSFTLGPDQVCGIEILLCAESLFHRVEYGMDNQNWTTWCHWFLAMSHMTMPQLN